MRIRSGLIGLSCLLVCANLIISLSYGLAADLFSSIEIPVFSDGYHIKIEIDRFRGTKSISYRIKKNSRLRKYSNFMIHTSMPEAGGHLLRYAKDIGTVFLMEQKQAGLPENIYLLPGNIRNLILKQSSG